MFGKEIDDTLSNLLALTCAVSSSGQKPEGVCAAPV